MKSIIVAYDKNRGIGAANDLLWLRDLPADLRHFRETTMGGAVIMGRKTYDSIGKPLSGRQNIVLSRSDDSIEGVMVVKNLDEAYAAVEPGREAFVIGGAQVYTLALDTVDRIFATEVQASFPQADTFFPEIDPAIWREAQRIHNKADDENKYDFDFVIYLRR